MSFSTFSSTAPFGVTSTILTVFIHTANKIGSVKRTFSVWRIRSKTANELNRLTARELADIGISRSDIPAICSKIVA